MTHPFDRLRRQYQKNADELAAMIASGRYRGKVLAQLTASHERAQRCAQMSDHDLSQHLANCQRQVSSELAQMLNP